MNIRLARATAICALVVTALGAGVLAFGTSPAAAQSACWRQVINATPWGRTPAYLVRDRDAV